MQAQICPCYSTTPLGLPVVPEVYIIVDMSVGLGGSGLAGLAAPSFMASSRLMTSTDFFTVCRKALSVLCGDVSLQRAVGCRQHVASSCWLGEAVLVNGFGVC